ncbi:MAG TPA: nucleotide exchange factor GrpE [Anaerolineales bacterium]|nr:nucleotide exchange factor GrpE [Anaerolineales bacterium]
MTDERNNSPEAQTQAVENEEHEAHTESADIEQLQQQLSEALDKSNEYLEGWQRARAEFANYKKRMEREQEFAYQTASGTILKKFLEVIDDLELALKNRPTQGEGAEWATGIEMIYRKLLSLLEGQGIQRMNAEGQMFDPNLHEAVTSEPSSDHESGQIIEVLRAGYLLGDRVLRPAMVRVAQ